MDAHFHEYLAAIAGMAELYGSEISGSTDHGCEVGVEAPTAETPPVAVPAA